MKKKKITITIPIFGGRIIGRITKKIIYGKIIPGNQGMEGPTVMETDERMQEI